MIDEPEMMYCAIPRFMTLCIIATTRVRMTVITEYEEEAE